eukprot:TRINITY_DN39129_c0_g1_i1.p1 TRINITY_DN39129_c0_g1~~TRINITY_DN39129_c0_g1_i1.p1  ORF type:complete len:263 (-),score=62.64 TRINITY_DN39129_c0_g1_i1:104-865(-)
MCIRYSCTGDYFFLFPFVHSTAMLTFELGTWLVLRDGPFTVRMSKNPLDYTLMVCISGVNYATSRGIAEWGTPVTWQVCLAYAVAFLAGDAAFGLFHYMAHRLTSMWARHKLHHEYKFVELNTIANFYAELPDGIVMNALLWPAALMTNFVGGPFSHEVIQQELLFPGLNAHHKYPKIFAHHIYFHELDLIDLLMGMERDGNFHNQHHLNAGGFFGAYGNFPDAWVRGIMDPIFAAFGSKTIVGVPKSSDQGE